LATEDQPSAFNQYNEAPAHEFQDRLELVEDDDGGLLSRSDVVTWSEKSDATLNPSSRQLVASTCPSKLQRSWKQCEDGSATTADQLLTDNQPSAFPEGGLCVNGLLLALFIPETAGSSHQVWHGVNTP
jgi:hypothetical protein